MSESGLAPSAYRELIARLKASKVPPHIVLMHLTHGFHAGATCGDCGAFSTLYVGATHTYCLQCYTPASLPGSTPACGKFRARECVTPNLPTIATPAPTVEQLELT